MWATTLALLYCFFNSQMDFDGITLLNLYIRIVTILSKMVELFALSHIYFKMFYIELGGKSWKYIGILDGIKFERNILTFAPKIIKLTVI